MNYPWTNFKSNFYRFTGVDWFSSLTSETLDFTMDSTVEREHDKSAEDVNDAAVENSEPPSGIVKPLSVNYNLLIMNLSDQ